MNNHTGYFVDKVSEDSFYENLLIGLPKKLNTLPNVRNKKLKRYPPASKVDILNWEQKHGVSLPTDFENLYLSCNGLLYTYTFTYELTNREEKDKQELIGKIEINPLEDLKPIQGFEIKPMARIHYDGFFYRLNLSPESKVFDISNCEFYHVVLVYPDAKTSPTIWIYDLKTFYFVANDLITYLRMAISHLGVPGWQFIFSPLGLPGISREMLHILAPGIVYEDRTLVSLEEDDNFTNKLDLGILAEDQFNKKVSLQSLSKVSSLLSTTERKKKLQRRGSIAKRSFPSQKIF